MNVSSYEINAIVLIHMYLILFLEKKDVNSNIHYVLVSNLNLYRSWLNSLNKIFPRVMNPKKSPRKTTCW